MEEAKEVGRFARYLIESQPEGAYLFVWETKESSFPEQDHLLDSVEDAKAVAWEDFGVPLTAWLPWEGGSLVG